MVALAHNLSTNVHCSRRFAGRTRSSWEKSLLPLSSSFFVSCFRRSSMSTARKIKSAPRYRYSRSGNQDMQVPTNTVGRGLTSLFSSLFLSLSFFLSFLSFSRSLFLFLSFSHTHVHTYTYVLSLSFSLCLSLSFSRSFTHSYTHTLSLFLFPSCSLSLPLFPRRTSISMARSRPSLETAHSAVPFVAPLDDDRPLCHRESTLATAVTLLAKDQVRFIRLDFGASASQISRVNVKGHVATSKPRVRIFLVDEVDV